MLNRRLAIVFNTTKNHIAKLDSIGLKTVKDLLLYFPRTYNDNTEYRKIADVRTDEVNILKGRLTSIFSMRTRTGKKMIRGVFTDDSGSIGVIWFNQTHLTRVLPRNKEIILSGKVKKSMNKFTLQSPSYEFLNTNTEQIHTGRIVPTYHETEGLNSKWIRSKIKPLVNEWVKHFPEYMPESVLDQQDLISYQEAIKNIHFPENNDALVKARERLAFDELFLLQLKVLQRKWRWQNTQEADVKKIQTHERALQTVRDELPFQLTKAQDRVLTEILADLNRPFPMRRLVQGDVGSGKTIVAALAALNVVKEGYQVAIMAPTEILAKQHYKTFVATLKGLNIQFIAGSTTKSTKQNIIRQMKTGTVDIVIGTHSLIQEGIGFKKLGLAIIDEQHRFGVKQRAVLKSFGTPHLLSMTATPIPRTLAITVYGDQDLSIIDEMPAGRQEIITRLVPERKRTDAYRWIEEQVKKGRQAFVICPLVEESDTLEVKSVTQEYATLQNEIFPDLKVGLLHGRMKQEEKDQIMQDFKDNKINVLTSTSVIEVGIDVPNASIMIIEGAERFGLSQLHQFRGRVGRGVHQSYCFLFTNSLSEDGSKRIKSMEQHASGFKLAEIDLKLRGPGEVYGIKQSGIPDLKVAKLTDFVTIEKARLSAIKIIKVDPLLQKHPQLAEKIAEKEEIYVTD